MLVFIEIALMSEQEAKLKGMLLGMAVAKVACNMATTSLGSMW